MTGFGILRAWSMASASLRDARQTCPMAQPYIRLPENSKNESVASSEPESKLLVSPLQNPIILPI